MLEVAAHRYLHERCSSLGRDLVAGVSIQVNPTTAPLLTATLHQAQDEGERLRQTVLGLVLEAVEKRGLSGGEVDEIVTGVMYDFRCTLPVHGVEEAAG